MKRLILLAGFCGGFLGTQATVVVSRCLVDRYAWPLTAAAAPVPEELKTAQQLRREAAAQIQSGQANPETRDQLKPRPIQPAVSTSTNCPNPATLDAFKHQISYERNEQGYPYKGLAKLHVAVWQRGPMTAFYVRDNLKGFAGSVRMADLYINGNLQGGGTCPANENWWECVEGFSDRKYLNYVVGTCTITVDTSAIPPWKPSPDDATKRRIASELRKEIEAEWPDVQEIVIRNFNLKDSQITMYLKMPDGDYFQGCGFHSSGGPHCEGWHMFGQAPLSSIRKWIFAEPYRLK